MNYIVELQKALDYIEDNLEEDINYEKIAKELGISSFYFHRIFSSIIGISPAEYIRNRRLTCAADELSIYKANILDVAINEIPKFWDEIKANGKLKEISKDFTRCTLGVCIGENNAKEYRYGIGIEMQEGDEKISGTEIINVDKSKWVVFKCEGNKAEDINKLWTKIYKEYFVTSEYKQSMNIDFELSDEKVTEIWIPISK